LGKCPNKADFIKGFSEFTNNLEDEEIDDWNAKDEEFYQYMNECYSIYSKDLTSEEKGKIWISAANYYTVKYDGRLDKGYKEAREKLKPGIVADFENFMETYPKEVLSKSLGTGLKALSKLLDGVSKNIKPELEKLGEELEKTTKELSKELEKVNIEN
jgi:hypothetical protein